MFEKLQSLKAEMKKKETPLDKLKRLAGVYGKLVGEYGDGYDSYEWNFQKYHKEVNGDLQKFRQLAWAYETLGVESIGVMSIEEADKFGLMGFFERTNKFRMEIGGVVYFHRASFWTHVKQTGFRKGRIQWLEDLDGSNYGIVEFRIRWFYSDWDGVHSDEDSIQELHTELLHPESRDSFESFAIGTVQYDKTLN